MISLGNNKVAGTIKGCLYSTGIHGIHVKLDRVAAVVAGVGGID